jgi:hypothetical protein
MLDKSSVIAWPRGRLAVAPGGAVGARDARDQDRRPC